VDPKAAVVEDAAFSRGRFAGVTWDLGPELG
jgi:hypothetical protein